MNGSVVLFPFLLVGVSAADYYFSRSSNITPLTLACVNTASLFVLYVAGLTNGLAGRPFPYAKQFDKAVLCNCLVYVYCFGKLVWLYYTRK